MYTEMSLYKITKQGYQLNIVADHCHFPMTINFREITAAKTD